MQGRVLIDGDGVRVAGEPRLEEVVDDGGVAGLKFRREMYVWVFQA